MVREIQLGTGSETNPLPALHANNADITNFSTGGGYDIWMDESEAIHAFDGSGALVAGGPDGLNVTDSTDFSEVLSELINNQSSGHPVIRLAQQRNPVQFTAYPCKSEQTLANGFTLRGWGTNRVVIETGSGANLGVVFDVTSGTAIELHHCHFRTNNTPPDTWLRIRDQAYELTLLETEFRDANNWGVDYQPTNTTGNWNEIIGCWFLDGAGLRIDGAEDVRIVGSRILSSMTIQNVNALALAGNEVTGATTLSGVTPAFSKFTEDPQNPNDWQAYADQSGRYTKRSEAIVTGISGDNTEHDLIDLNDHRSGLFVVMGSDQASSATFTDLVTVADRVAFSTTTGAERNSPGGRSYGWNGTTETLAIAIDDSSKTYDCAVSAISGNPN